MKATVLRTKYEGSFSAAEARCGFGQCVEHRLKMKGRTADDLQHLGGRGVLLQRFVQLTTEPRDLCLAKGRTARDTALGALPPFRFNALRGRALAGVCAFSRAPFHRVRP